MKKKNSNSHIEDFKKYYKEAFGFIFKIKYYVSAIIFLFLISIFFGFFIKISPEIESVLLQKLREITLMFSGLNIYQTIWMIFSNNIYVGFLSIILGLFIGIFPIISALSNGFIIGYVARMAVSTEGFLTLWKLLPHGIFELPAIFVSMALGLNLGMCVLFYRKKIKNELTETGKAFLLITVPLLIIASIIEGILIFMFK